MARVTPIQTNFTSGEVSLNMRGRVDTTRYHNGAEELLNFIVRPQGGAWRRPGTKFVYEVKTSSKKTILQEFIFSNVQAYVLEFGDQYMRVYKDGGVVLSAGVPVEIATPYLEADLAELYFAQSADVLYISHPSYATRKLTRTSHTSWTLTTVDFKDGPYLPVNSTTESLVLSNIADSATVTCNNSIFVVGDVNKYVEVRVDGQWKLMLITAYVSGTEVTVKYAGGGGAFFETPIEAKLSLASGHVESTHAGTFTTDCDKRYMRTSISGVPVWVSTLSDGYVSDVKYAYYTFVTISVASGNLKSYTAGTDIFTLSNATITGTVKTNSGSALFASSDVGRYMRLNYAGEIVVAKISAYTSSSQVSVTLNNFPKYDTSASGYFSVTPIWNGGITDIWQLGAWSATTGYPAVVTFHEQRLCFARTATEPQTVWMSVSGDYENFAPTQLDATVLDDDAVTYTLVSNEVNPINWMISGPVLVIGSASAEWQVKASSINEALTPTNITVLPQTTHGSSVGLKPRRIASSVMFFQRSTHKLREMTYSFEIDAFTARDTTVISEHILRRGTKVVDSAYQKEPHSIMWTALQDGSMAGMTYEKDQEVVAWHQHQLGGTSVYVESLATVPSSDGSRDELWMVVKRTINGSTKRYVEYMVQELDSFTTTSLTDGLYLDCALTYTGTPATTISGLTHLEGQSVYALADGIARGPFTVTTGAITIPVAASTVHVGLNYTSRIKTLPIEAGAMDGTAQGRTKRVHRLMLALCKSYSYSHGADTSGMILEDFSLDTNLTGKIFTGSVAVPFSGRYDFDGQVYVKSEGPYPLNVLAIMMQLSTND